MQYRATVSRSPRYRSGSQSLTLQIISNIAARLAHMGLERTVAKTLGVEGYVAGLGVGALANATGATPDRMSHAISSVIDRAMLVKKDFWKQNITGHGSADEALQATRSLTIAEETTGSDSSTGERRIIGLMSKTLPLSQAYIVALKTLVATIICFVVVAIGHMALSSEWTKLKSCWDAILAWSTHGRLDFWEGVDFSYSPAAKVNVPQVVECLDLLRRTALPFAVQTFDQLVRLMGVLRVQPTSRASGIVMFALGRPGSPEGFQLMVNTGMGFGKVMPYLMLANMICNLQIRILNERATVTLCEGVRLSGANEVDGNGCCDDNDEETLLKRCSESRQQAGLLDAFPCSFSTLPHKCPAPEYPPTEPS